VKLLLLKEFSYDLQVLLDKFGNRLRGGEGRGGRGEEGRERNREERGGRGRERRHGKIGEEREDGEEKERERMRERGEVLLGKGKGGRKGERTREVSQSSFLGSSERGLHLQDICADLVKEVLVMGNDESYPFEAMLQIRFQPNQSMQIEMIGWLRDGTPERRGGWGERES
jgi:hypothetical protein